jgi:hypothetical protein
MAEVKQQRLTINTQTMMGQFYFFVADTLYAFFLFVALLPGISPGAYFEEA